MNKRFTNKIYNNTRRDLDNANIPYKTIGSGKYMFVTYDLQFRSATLRRFPRLPELADTYTAALEADNCHLSIHLRYLAKADLLFDEEKESMPEDDTHAYRMSYCFKALKNAAA